MLKCPAYKIFQATTGGKKFGNRPQWWSYITFLAMWVNLSGVSAIRCIETFDLQKACRTQEHMPLYMGKQAYSRDTLLVEESS